MNRNVQALIHLFLYKDLWLHSFQQTKHEILKHNALRGE